MVVVDEAEEGEEEEDVIEIMGDETVGIRCIEVLLTAAPHKTHT